MIYPVYSKLMEITIVTFNLAINNLTPTMYTCNNDFMLYQIDYIPQDDIPQGGVWKIPDTGILWLIT